MRVAIDIMGGDKAPQEIVAGGLQAAKRFGGDQMIFVGRPEAINSIGKLPDNVSFVEAKDVMAMDESVTNIMRKKESSIWVATKLVKDGQADAVVSAGSTAAQMAAATLQLGRIKGISRPAIGTVFPTIKGGRIMLDVGANADCEPEMLLQFALMGNVYAQLILGAAAPRIALLSNGTEAHKGNKLTLSAYQLIEQTGLNFIGNKEGRDLLAGDFDVIVCDGFSGNIALKSMEGAFGALIKMLKSGLTKSVSRKIGAAMVMPAFRELKQMVDYEEYGGAPLLGVQGVSIVCHGSSSAKAIDNAVAVAINCLKNDFVLRLTTAVADEKQQ